MLVKTFVSVLAFFVMIGCSDDATVVSYEEVDSIPCMRLVVFPPDKQIESVVKSLYSFDSSCEYRLVVAKKSGIVCNSNQNAQEKALSSFPSGFIRFDLYKKNKPLYSYYKDLTTQVKDSDIKKGFERLQKDML